MVSIPPGYLPFSPFKGSSSSLPRRFNVLIPSMRATRLFTWFERTIVLEGFDHGTLDLLYRPVQIHLITLFSFEMRESVPKFISISFPICVLEFSPWFHTQFLNFDSKHDGSMVRHEWLLLIPPFQVYHSWCSWNPMWDPHSIIKSRFLSLLLSSSYRWSVFSLHEVSTLNWQLMSSSALPGSVVLSWWLYRH